MEYAVVDEDDPMSRTPGRRVGFSISAATAIATALLAAPPTRASFLQGDTLASAANVLAIIVICIVPIIGIVVFWMVHVLPEKIAHKRHHPQKDAIQVLCLLSLVFGGMLWPIAWLWAYSKPVLYKMAYGTDKSDEYHDELATRNAETESVRQEDFVQLRNDVDRLLARGNAPEGLAAIRDQLAALESRPVSRTEETR